jgi:geranylgeranyl transferase type-2 subunit alpha
MNDSTDASVLHRRWRAELDLALAALKHHPKAYPAWQHRLWLLFCPRLVARLSPRLWMDAVRTEFAMAEMLLAQDGRNFHGWAHRMRVRDMASGQQQVSSPHRELDFVTEKINTDFANYSAWHHRSTLLPTMHKSADEFLAQELDLVRQAFYTEPDVQSAWFYHRWLLAGAPARGVKTEVHPRVWADELDACEQLLDIEPDARWALHAKADLLTRLGRRDDAKEVFVHLASVDPIRRGFYMHKISQIKQKAATK